ncbi:cellulase family glycosylhydrolase [Streptomyces sp. CA-135486]|uniref:cellulase family glycosylhydrolase n=1 Tax=Streptomyces sp. CA-135486 TaxID=3240049 RepID=UPI003D8DD077
MDPRPPLILVMTPSHGTEYLSTLSRAADKLPMFVTEFGTQTASGDGGNNFSRSQQYLDLMASKKISWSNWNYSDDERSWRRLQGRHLQQKRSLDRQWAAQARRRLGP